MYIYIYRMSELRKVLDAFDVANGKNLKKHAEAQSVDEELMSPLGLESYAFAKVKDAAAAADAPPEYELVEREHQNTATHLQHLASGVAIDLITLSIAQCDDKFRIRLNNSDMDAFVWNGKRSIGTVYEEFRDDAWFVTKSDRVTAAYGGDGWKDLIGDVVVEKRKEKSKHSMRRRRCSVKPKTTRLNTVARAGVVNVGARSTEDGVPAAYYCLGSDFLLRRGWESAASEDRGCF